MSTFRKEIIEEVQKYPILFDHSHQYFKNAKKKNEVWKEVAAKLNLKCATAKKKWSTVRDTYMRYLKKEQRNRANNKETYKKWEWADHMEFFRPYFSAARVSTTNCGEIWNMNDDTIFGYPETIYNDDESQVELIEDNSNQAEENVKFEETLISQISSSSVNIVTTSKSGPPDLANSSHSTSTEKRRRRNNSRENNLSSTTAAETSITFLNNINNHEIDEIDRPPDSANSSHSTSTEKRRRRNNSRENNLSSTTAAETLISFLNNKNNHGIDEIDLLFLAHAQTMKKFTKRRQIITKMKIAQVMMEQELENIGE